MQSHDGVPEEFVLTLNSMQLIRIILQLGAVVSLQDMLSMCAATNARML
jgi:hypothetical protein